MATLTTVRKDRIRKKQELDFSLDQHIKRKLTTANRKRRKRVVEPKSRSEAHEYLAFICRLKGFPYTSARESMQLTAQFFGVELPAISGRGSRSRTCIELANLIQAKTGINLPRHQ